MKLQGLSRFVCGILSCMAWWVIISRGTLSSEAVGKEKKDGGKEKILNYKFYPVQNKVLP